MSTIIQANPVGVYVDSTKGSMTNKYQCSKEHAKNELKTYVKLGLLNVGATAGAVGAYAARNSKPMVAVAQAIGKFLSKVGIVNTKGLLEAEKLAKYAKAGKIGMLVAGAVALTGIAQNIIGKYLFKKGQIDQKYTDAAKIEATTKNVILETPYMNRVGVYPDGTPVYFDPSRIKNKPIIDARTGEPISQEEYEKLAHTYVK